MDSDISIVTRNQSNIFEAKHSDFIIHMKTGDCRDCLVVRVLATLAEQAGLVLNIHMAAQNLPVTSILGI